MQLPYDEKYHEDEKEEDQEEEEEEDKEGRLDFGHLSDTRTQSPK